MNKLLEPTIDVVEETKICPNYHVILHNDDINDMWHVATTIQNILRMSEQDAMSIMLKAHEEGLAIAKTESKEHAEFHQEQLQGCFLTVTIEPAD